MKPKCVSDLEGERGKSQANWFLLPGSPLFPVLDYWGLILLFVASLLAHCWVLDLLSIHNHMLGCWKSGGHMLAPGTETKAWVHNLP